VKVKIILYKPDGIAGLQTEEVTEEWETYDVVDGCLNLYRETIFNPYKIYSGLAWKSIEVVE